MKIITISREFGSGGRELGKRLADALGYAYYDREIEAAIAERTGMDIRYIAQMADRNLLMTIPLHFGQTFNSGYVQKQHLDILVEKQRVMKNLACQSDCVIVGRAADAILSEYNPFKIFVYADMDYKIKRCQGYAEVKEHLSVREMEKSIRKIDAARSQYHRLFPGLDWGNREQYHLCVNTTGLEIKRMVPPLAEYVRNWFANRTSP